MKLFFGKKPHVTKDDDLQKDVQGVSPEPETLTTEEEEIAVVIALAIRIYISRIQEIEQVSLTLEKAIKPYSPWSSKIYGLRQQPMFIPNLKSRLK